MGYSNHTLQQVARLMKHGFAKCKYLQYYRVQHLRKLLSSIARCVLIPMEWLKDVYSILGETGALLTAQKEALRLLVCKERSTVSSLATALAGDVEC